MIRGEIRLEKVLVVDDDPAIVNLLGSFLRGRAYQVVTASDGAEAVRKVKLEHPGIVLLDLNMPGKGGLEVLDEIKNYDHGIGVIVITGLSDPGIGREALKKGAFDFLTKPFDLRHLEKVLWWQLQLNG
jgi:DNA-binding NtrC family response regulator